jgi:UDP-N-acetylmuramate dehydrogenase
MLMNENEKLSKHVTIKIGGVASKYYIPENVAELSELIKQESDYKIISGGSNLLINDKKIFPCVIDMKSCCQEFELLDSGEVFVGASVRIQKLIKNLQELNLGGFEFLYSLPALFGGIIVMNAGRGSDGKSIAKFIKSVRCLNDSGEVFEIDVNKCMFGYRKSIFQEKKWIVLGATLKCENIDSDKSKKLVQERIEHCKKSQDMRYPNFGSAFCCSNGYIMHFIMHVYKFKNMFNKNSASFSDKSINWIVNKGNGTFDEVIRCLKTVEIIHKLTLQKSEIEVKIWE